MTDESEPAPTPGAAKQRRARARAAAIREAAAEAVADLIGPAPVQQLLPLAPAGAELDELQPPAPATGGRPAGAVDRKAAEWRAFMLARYRSPLVVLAETYSRDVRLLARELGCTRLEAFQLQLRAAQEAAPYLHSKAPASLQVEGAAVAPIVVGVTPGMAARLGVAAGPVIEVVENQAPGDDEGGGF